MASSAPSELVGAAGRRYRFKELLQERPHLGRVWLATSEISLFTLASSSLGAYTLSDLRAIHLS